jgi:hypothetical protein
MKKGAIVFSLVFLFSIILAGCSLKKTQISFESKKPTNFYYSQQLVKALTGSSSCTIRVYETNLHTEKEIPKEGHENIMNFFEKVGPESFITRPQDIPDKPKYKLFIATDKGKFVINVYNDKIAAVHPWDGSQEMDYIDMTSIYKLYNLHGLCKFFIKQ